MPVSNFSRSIDRTLLRRGTKYDVELLSTHDRQGKSYTREVIRHPGSVIVLPILQSPGALPRVVLIENFRITLEASILELPAGTRSLGEDPDVCAGRELTEETGYQATSLTPLTDFFTAPGLTDERMHAFVATGLTPVGQRLELDEDIRVLDLPVSDAMNLALSGQLKDAKSALVLLLARARGFLPS
jgi:ADP-ribose pyrophosphatase